MILCNLYILGNFWIQNLSNIWVLVLEIYFDFPSEIYSAESSMVDCFCQNSYVLLWWNSIIICSKIRKLQIQKYFQFNNYCFLTNILFWKFKLSDAYFIFEDIFLSTQSLDVRWTKVNKFKLLNWGLKWKLCFFIIKPVKFHRLLIQETKTMSIRSHRPCYEISFSSWWGRLTRSCSFWCLPRIERKDWFRLGISSCRG